jgi:hypothetical protein
VWQCPANLTQPFKVKISLPVEDFQDPDLVVVVKSWLSGDGGNTWSPYHGGVFNGGTQVDKGGNLLTSFTFSGQAGAVAGKSVKAEVTTTKRVKVTMIVETID